MNDLQKIEREILVEFVKICDQLKLTYFLVCGSALGAVKYGGFIPWDDDLDVALPREDYETFCEKAPSMIKDYYFIQNYKSDPKYPLFMTKIRDIRTTFVEPLYQKVPMNHGVYIDVFPLDGYPQEEKLACRLEKEKKLFDFHRMVRYSYNRFSRENIKHPKAIALYWLHKWFGFWRDTSKVIERFDRIASSYSCDESHLWCNHGNWQGKLEYAPKEQYGNGRDAYFEGIKVRIPENYDAYLTQKYGDWRDDLPDELKVPPHRPMILDCENSYESYIHKISKNGEVLYFKK